MAFAPQASRHLNWEIAQLYTKGWMIWGILTFLGGLAVLILQDPGFRYRPRPVILLLLGVRSADDDGQTAAAQSQRHCDYYRYEFQPKPAS